MNKPFHHNDCYKYLQQYFFRMCWYRKWVRVPLEANRISNEVFSFENNKILKSSNLELSLEYTQRHNFVTLCVYIVYFKSFAREKWTCQNQQKKPKCTRLFTAGSADVPSREGNESHKSARGRLVARPSARRVTTVRICLQIKLAAVCPNANSAPQETT